MKKKEEKKFGKEEFVKDLWKTMKSQEETDPSLALLHNRLEGSLKLIGLTGGIASGKSTVSAFFKKVKIPVIDADELAHKIVEPKKKAYRQIVQCFGEGILNSKKEIDREKLGDIVFSDPGRRNLLESITHPEIFKEIAKQVNRIKKKKGKIAVIDAALLFESILHEYMDYHIVVKIDPKVQVQRLMKRDNLNHIQAWQRVLAQMPTPEKEKRAGFVIDNSGSMEQIECHCREILKQLG